MIKQRGTWALDTMRMSFWGKRRGLNLRQHIQFAELGLFYLLSFGMLIFAVTPVFALALDIRPLATNQLAYALHFWPYAAAMELTLACLGERLPYEDIWRARQIWLGLAPVYAWATINALLYGPNRKPKYRVTRKEHAYAIYWRETLPQAVLLLALIGTGSYHIATHSLVRTADLGSLFWAGFFALCLSRTVRNAWHGVDLRQVMRRGARRALRMLCPGRRTTFFARNEDQT